jgi:Tol biopolymer transport system component
MSRPHHLTAALATGALATALLATASTTTAPAGAVPPGIDGPLLVVADHDHSDHYDLFRTEPDGSGRTNLTGEDKAYVVDGAQASPDGRRIAYHRSGGTHDQIWVMDADGSDKTPLTTAAQLGGSSPTWSPDGTRIAFVRDGGDDDAGTDIWTMAADGSDQALWADEGGWSLFAPEWSPDGSTIAFVRSDQAAGSRIWTRNAAGGLATARTAYNDRVRRPSWSPDGSKILFWHDAGNVQGLYTMNPTGGGLALLRAMPSADAGDYTWSPEGDRVAFTTRTGDRLELWVMDADGSDAQQVSSSDDVTNYRSVHWSTPPELDPVVLPVQVQGVPVAPLRLPGVDGATHAVSAGVLPDGLALSADGSLTGTPTTWGDSVFEVTVSGDGEPVVTAYSMHVLDPENPVANVVSPAASSATSHPVTTSLVHPVQWAGHDATTAVVRWDLRHRRTRWNSTAAVLTHPASWQGVTTKGLSHPLARGHTYCYSVRARDESGRTGAWSAEKCTIAPLDQTALSRSSGWALRSGSSYSGGTALVTTRKGASLTRPGTRLRRVGVLATTCPTCGALDVYVGTSRVGRISLARGTRTLHRKALLLPRLGQRSGTVRLVVVTKGRQVRVDGLLVGAR